MSPAATWLLVVPLIALATWGLFALDSWLWHEVEERKGDRERLAQLQEWQTALGAQYVKTNTEWENKK